jgi:MFS family permease
MRFFITIIILIGLLIQQSSGSSNLKPNIVQDKKSSHIENNRPPSNTLLLMNSSVGSLKKKDNSYFLSILLPWLYFLSISINFSSFPKYVNWCVNHGSIKISPQSQQVYGYYSGLDSFFTFLSVNLVGCLSDRYGRKPFIIFSLAGLGTSYFTSCFANRQPNLFYLAGSIDGLTSSMFGQAQAYATDYSRENGDGSTSLSEVISKFQGLAIGLAYIIGIPIGILLSKLGSHRMPLYTSIFLCSLGCLLTFFFLPESLKLPTDENGKIIRSPILWTDANPFGALKMVTRNNKLLLGSIAYFFLHIAQTGANVVWINYMGYRFGWPAEYAGAPFMLLGLTVAFIPTMLM